MISDFINYFFLFVWIFCNALMNIWSQRTEGTANLICPLQSKPMWIKVSVLTQVAHPRWPIWAYWNLRHRSTSFHDISPILDSKHLGQYRSIISIDIGHWHRSTSIIDVAQYRVSTSLNIGHWHCEHKVILLCYYFLKGIPFLYIEPPTYTNQQEIVKHVRNCKNKVTTFVKNTIFL